MTGQQVAHHKINSISILSHRVIIIAARTGLEKYGRLEETKKKVYNFIFIHAVVLRRRRRFWVALPFCPGKNVDFFLNAVFSFHVYEEVKVVGFLGLARSRIARITIAAMGPLLLIFRATRAGRQCSAITIAFILVKLIKLSTNNFSYTHIIFFCALAGPLKTFLLFRQEFFGERLEKVAGHLFMLLFRLFGYNSAVIL